MFASRSKVEELEERVEELEKRLSALEPEEKELRWLAHPSTFGDPTAWLPFWTSSEVYDEGADYKGRRSSNDLNDMGLG